MGAALGLPSPLRLKFRLNRRAMSERALGSSTGTARSPFRIRIGRDQPSDHWRQGAQVLAQKKKPPDWDRWIFWVAIVQVQLDLTEWILRIVT
jgi:hypothetical protein